MSAVRRRAAPAKKQAVTRRAKQLPKQRPASRPARGPAQRPAQHATPSPAKRAARPQQASVRKRRGESPAERIERAAAIVSRLEAAYPQARCALDHQDAFQLLVATILSAQCTDARVNMVTPVLFAKYASPGALAAAPQGDVEEIIRSTGFFRAKAKALIGVANAITDLRMYEKLAGMTGTALTEAEEFDKIYKLDVIAIPTNLEHQAMREGSPLVMLEARDEQGYKYNYYARRDEADKIPVYYKRKDFPDIIYRTEEVKFRAITSEILRYHAMGRPMLVGTTSVELS